MIEIGTLVDFVFGIAIIGLTFRVWRLETRMGFVKTYMHESVAAFEKLKNSFIEFMDAIMDKGKKEESK